jgi:hypothetical protein
MRRHVFFIVLLLCSAGAHALESLRVGSQLLVVGDSSAKVKALMGKPDIQAPRDATKSKASRKSSSQSAGKGKPQQAKEKGEKWQYRRDGHITIFTVANGKVVHIEDHAL